MEDKGDMCVRGEKSLENGGRLEMVLHVAGGLLPSERSYHTLPMILSFCLEELSRKANVMKPVLNLISKLPNRS